MGKGNFKLAPILFTQGKHGTLKILSHTQIQYNIGISHKRNIFFSLLKEVTHASGWHLVKNIYNKISLKGSKTITNTATSTGMNYFCII